MRDITLLFYAQTQCKEIDYRKIETHLNVARMQI